MLQIACSMEGKWQDRCRGRKTEQIKKNLRRDSAPWIDGNKGICSPKVDKVGKYLTALTHVLQTRKVS